MFLQSNPHISNRLACLVRGLLEIPYLKTVFVVFATLGVHLVEPFYARTIEDTATHSKLKVFYKSLFESMDTTVDDSFFEFKEPAFSGVSQNLFDGVKKSYKPQVLQVVSDIAKEHMDEVKTLTNFILPECRTVLARQRRDYGISDEFPAQYPVEEQAANIDETPVNNLAMERQFGTVDYRLKKLKTLEAVGRSMILDKTQDLRAESNISFRSFKNEVRKKRELQLQWSTKMKDKFASGANEKVICAQTKERKRLDMLEKLKLVGGPFTDADSVQTFLDIPENVLGDKEKQKRLKLEMQFSRESSTTLPRVDPIFRIQVTLPNKKRRDKTSAV